MRIWVYTVVFLGIWYVGEVFAADNIARTFPRLPQAYKNKQYKGIKIAFEKLSEKHLVKEKFQKWSMDRPEEDILKEFDKLDKWREGLWYKNPSAKVLESKEDFMISQELLINHLYRKPHLIAFAYNATDTSYNSSTVVLNGHTFLSMEAPSEGTLRSFFNLLHNFAVTHLVRLTPSMEDGNFKSYPYWRGNEETDSNTEQTYLNIPLESEEDIPHPYRLRYISTNSWKDHHTTAVEDLLNLILQARRGYTLNSLIAVHCHSGVSRTGTFIAGFLLLDEIDNQIAKGKKLEELDISIEKVVKQLSLQRFYMVGKPKQYLLLYRLVDHYVKRLLS